MWITKKKYNSLIDRIKKIENQVALIEYDIQSHLNLWLPPEYSNPYLNKSKLLPIESIIYKLIDNAKLCWKEGIEGEIIVRKKEAKK